MTGLLAHGLVAGYPGQPPALDGCTLDVRRGRRLALLGANGSGKTTLLRCLSGSLVPQAGRIELDGSVLAHTRAGLTRHRERVQLVVQDPDDQLFSADVTRDVSFGPLNLGCSDAETRTRVDETLTLLGIAHLRDRPTHQLSYGERKRVAIAGAVAMRPALLLLDEPTAGLDPAGTDELFEALAALEAHGTTVILSTHDVTLALEWSFEAAVLAGGRVVQGPPAQLLGDEDLLARARLRMPWPLRLGQALRSRELIGADQHPRDVAGVVDAVQRSRPASATTA